MDGTLIYSFSVLYMRAGRPHILMPGQAVGLGKGVQCEVRLHKMLLLHREGAGAVADLSESLVYGDRPNQHIAVSSLEGAARMDPLPSFTLGDIATFDRYVPDDGYFSFGWKADKYQRSKQKLADVLPMLKRLREASWGVDRIASPILAWQPKVLDDGDTTYSAVTGGTISLVDATLPCFWANAPEKLLGDIDRNSLGRRLPSNQACPYFLWLPGNYYDKPMTLDEYNQGRFTLPLGGIPWHGPGVATEWDDDAMNAARQHLGAAGGFFLGQKVRLGDIDIGTAAMAGT